MGEPDGQAALGPGQGLLGARGRAVAAAQQAGQAAVTVPDVGGAAAAPHGAVLGEDRGAAELASCKVVEGKDAQHDQEEAVPGGWCHAVCQARGLTRKGCSSVTPRKVLLTRSPSPRCSIPDGWRWATCRKLTPGASQQAAASVELLIRVTSSRACRLLTGRPTPPQGRGTRGGHLGLAVVRTWAISVCTSPKHPVAGAECLSLPNGAHPPCRPHLVPGPPDSAFLLDPAAQRSLWTHSTAPSEAVS